MTQDSKSIVEVLVVNLSGLATSFSLSVIPAWIEITNSFFHDTMYIWKAVPVLLTSAYTVKKIFYEKKRPDDRQP